MGMVYKKEDRLEKLFEEFATLPDQKKEDKNNQSQKEDKKSSKS